MRLFSLAVVAALFAVGFGYAQEKKAEKKAEKKGAVTGTLTKIDGDKLTVTTKGDAGEKTEVYTTNDKTKFFQQEAAPAAKDGDKPVDPDKKADPDKKPVEGEKKAEEKKPETTAKADDKKATDGDKKPADGDKKAEKKAAPKRTEIKLADLKTGSKVAVTAGEDKVITELVVMPAPAKKKDSK